MPLGAGRAVRSFTRTPDGSAISQQQRHGNVTNMLKQHVNSVVVANSSSNKSNDDNNNSNNNNSKN